MSCDDAMTVAPTSTRSLLVTCQRPLTRIVGLRSQRVCKALDGPPFCRPRTRALYLEYRAHRLDSSGSYDNEVGLHSSRTKCRRRPNPFEGSRKDRVEPAPLDAFHADAERYRHRRRDIAAANDRQLHAAANRRSRRNEQRVVVRVERALAVVAKILRRAVLLYTVREIAERVARRRLEHRVAHQRVLRGGWQSERLEV